MSSGLLSIARTALLTHQSALQTVSQNIANAETPGYSRQEAVLVANTPLRMSYGSVGTGVHIETILRRRDILLDDNFRSASTLAGGTEMRRDLMSQVESVFGEPSDAGMASALDAFWGSWSDLSASPNSVATRSVVQQRGRQVATLFNEYDTQLTQQRSSTLERLQNTVGTINAIAEQVAELNTRIVTSESVGQTNNDLRDLRDMKLDELSKIAGTRVLQQANGNVTVLIGNSTLVESGSARPLTISLDVPVPTPTTPLADIDVKIRLGGSLDRLAPLGGELKAIVDVVNTDIPDARGRLDAMAAQFAQAVNTVHTTGYTFTGNTIPGTAAGNFFDPGSATIPVSAATLKLSSAVAIDPTKIAASGNANGPTDNSIAQGVSALRIADGTVSFTGSGGASESGSFLGFFRSMVTRIGLETASATDNATVYRSLTDQADARRQAVSGVSTDEELVNMMRVQQSYQAATKMIKVADDMMQTLLSLV
jgi:flagellar hook-associated protein 1 FlgK